MVSHTRVKTPTAAAALLISHLKAVLDALNDSQERIAAIVQQKILSYKAGLANIQTALPRLVAVVMTRQRAMVDTLNQRLSAAIQHRTVSERARLTGLEQRLPLLLDRRLTQERHRMEMVEEKVKMLDPNLLLRRGYSITLKDGKAVKDAKLLRPGDEIETRLSKGTIKSIIK